MHPMYTCAHLHIVGSQPGCLSYLFPLMHRCFDTLTEAQQSKAMLADGSPMPSPDGFSRCASAAWELASKVPRSLQSSPGMHAVGCRRRGLWSDRVVGLWGLARPLEARQVRSRASASDVRLAGPGVARRQPRRPLHGSPHAHGHPHVAWAARLVVACLRPHSGGICTSVRSGALQQSRVDAYRHFGGERPCVLC